MKRFLRAFLCVILAAAAASPAFPASQGAAPATPSIALERFEVVHYDGFWAYDKSVRPSRGEAGERGAPLCVAFVFLVGNPNDVALNLTGLSFNARIDGFDLLRVNNRDAFWIPPGKTARVRVEAFLTADGAFRSLSANGGRLLSERGVSAWDEVERIWKGAAAYSIPVEIREGRAEYTDGGRSFVTPFSQIIPPAN